jgi:hypothetical protein
VGRRIAGELLLGRYRLDVRIGTGGAGAVWRARDTRLGRPVAIKVLSKRSRGAAAAVAEARTVAALANPHIVALYELTEDPDDYFLVTELIDGASLEMVLAEGSLAPDEAAAVLSPIASALGAAHRAGVVHGDVKPANVLLGREGQVKLTDFGAAGFARAAGRRPRSIEASPAYAAPEVLAGHASTFASDIYSLGATLARTIGGAPTGAALPREVTGQMRALVKELTADVREDRPDTADEVAEELALIGDRVDRRALVRHLAATHGVEPGEVEEPDEGAAAARPAWWTADLIARVWPALLLGGASGWACQIMLGSPLAAALAGLALAAAASVFLWPAGLVSMLLVAAALLNVTLFGLPYLASALVVVLFAPAWVLVGRRDPTILLSPLLVPVLGLFGVPTAAAPILAKTLPPRQAGAAGLAGAGLLALMWGLWPAGLESPVATAFGLPYPGSTFGPSLVSSGFGQTGVAVLLVGLAARTLFVALLAFALAWAARGPRWLGPAALICLIVGAFAVFRAGPLTLIETRLVYADLSLSLIIGVAVMAAAPASSA